MNRRQFSLTLPVAAILVGCDTDQKPSSTSTLLNNNGVQQAMKSVEYAIGALEGDVGGFDDENWREVVPNVQAAAANVRDTFERLRTELGVPNS